MLAGTSFLIALALGALGFGTPVHARAQETAKEASQPYVLHQDAQEVILYCTVLDRQGHPVNDLKQQDFTILDGKTKVAVASFRHQDDPVSLGLVLDNSGSMKARRDAVNAAALALVQASNQQDEVFVLNFADQPYLDQDFTNDLGKLRAGLEKGKTAGGGTALFDTLLRATDHLAHDGRQTKQAVVVVTDGRDNASMASLEHTIRRVQQTNGPVVYAIGLLYDASGADSKPARRALESLAEETGGLAFFPRSLDEVGSIAQEVARDLRNQYRITFHPPAGQTDGAYHAVTVEAALAGKGKLRVRTRKGYLRAGAASNVKAAPNR